MPGQPLELGRDQLRELSVHGVFGVAEVEAGRGGRDRAVGVQEESRVDPDSVRDVARHDHGRETAVDGKERGERVRDQGDELLLTRRSGLVLEAGLARGDVSFLDEKSGISLQSDRDLLA